MNTKLHPKILKNLYDLRHDRYLQKSHTIVNVCIAVWLAFLGSVATYLFGGGGTYNDLILIFLLVGTSIIFSLFFLLYKISRRMRFDTIRKIKELDSNFI